MHAHLSATLSEQDYNKLAQAAKITNDKPIQQGLSITTATKEFNKVHDLIIHLTYHHDSKVSKIANNIIDTANTRHRNGMFGDGVFLME